MFKIVASARSKPLLILVLFCLNHSIFATFSDDVALFKSQMRYDARFIDNALKNTTLLFSLLYDKMPMVANTAADFPASSTIKTINSTIEPIYGESYAHLYLTVQFKKKLPRQNYSYLVSDKVIRYVALGKDNRPLKIPIKPMQSMLSDEIINFSCSRIQPDEASKFAVFNSSTESIDLVTLLDYPFNFCTG